MLQGIFSNITHFLRIPIEEKGLVCYLFRFSSFIFMQSDQYG